jgi:predicted S18 family serine protease
MSTYKLAVIIFVVFTAQAYAYTTHIAAPAVLLGVDRGVLTNVTLNIVPGDGVIVVNNGSTTVASDTLQSVHIAVNYATNYLNVSENKYNFTFIIGNNDSNVSGPSAGLALTLLTISGLKQRPLSGNFTLTGTISPDGVVGPIGGVFDKVQAAKSIGSRFVLVPYVNNTTSEYMLYYLSQQAYGTPLVEVSNVSQALPYAFGSKKPTALSFNLTTDYKPDQISNASEICPSCNGTQFLQLTNFTFNFTENEISRINETLFGSVRNQLSSQLEQYRKLASKGYYYTGADLAFIEDPTAFIFANYNTSQYVAMQIISNVTAYCNSLNYMPNMTASNYELIVGAQTRLAWADVTLSAAMAELNASQTSDQVILSLAEAAPAQSWCAAAHEMYAMANSSTVSPTVTSSKVREDALNGLSAARARYGNQFYVDAANYSISNGDYAAALYSLTYANVFYNYTDANYSKTSSLVSNALSSAQGLWPTQFALQGSFYLSEAGLNSMNSSQYFSFVSDAYTTAALSLSLDSTNNDIRSNLVPAYEAAVVPTGLTDQINQISSELSAIMAVLVMILALMFVIFLILLYILLASRRRGARR